MPRQPLLALLALLVPAATPAVASDALLDPASSHFGFSLATRWGQTLEGRFPQAEGGIVQLPDGRQQVRIRLQTGSVEIRDSPVYTRYTRGEGFFDAGRHPRVEFVSDPYAPAMLQVGGPMAGRLSIRDVTRQEVLEVAPSRCEYPGVACAIVVRGVVRREDYGMRRWRAALGSRVHLQMHVRLEGPVQ